MPRLVVLKFGGTSVANAARIRRAALRIRTHTSAGHQVVAVVSAAGQSTDRVLKRLAAVTTRTNTRSAREHDRALATGEDLSAALLAAALNDVDVKAISLRGGEAGLHAEGPFNAGRLCALDVSRLTQLLENDFVPVVSGFQAVRADGETVTLGRGGSDATAIFIAGVLKADACHIITDVRAVCDADPRTHPDARPFPRLTHAALVQITAAGGEVVQPAAAKFAEAFGTRLHVYHYGAPLSGHSGTTVALRGDTVCS